MLLASSDDKGPHHEVHSLKALLFPGICLLAAGAAGEFCPVLVGYPFDLVKVRLQTLDRAVRRSALDVLKSNLGRKSGIKVCKRLKCHADCTVMAARHLRRRLRASHGRDTNLQAAFSKTCLPSLNISLWMPSLSWGTI